MTDALTPFLAATIRTATPLALAALGELLVERAGLINIGLEGAVLAGAFGALAGATAGGVAGGYVGAMVGGLLLAAVFAYCVLVLRADQIITGMALTLLSVGATGMLYRAWYGASGAALHAPTSGPVAIPGLVTLPVFGAALFDQPAVTYLVYVLTPLLAWWLFRTHAGLALRGSSLGRLRGKPVALPCARSASDLTPQRRRASLSPGFARWPCWRAGCWGVWREERWCSSRPAPSSRTCRPAEASLRWRSWCSADGGPSVWRSGRCSLVPRARCSTPSRRWDGPCHIRSFSPRRTC